MEEEPDSELPTILVYQGVLKKTVNSGFNSQIIPQVEVIVGNKKNFIYTVVSWNILNSNWILWSHAIQLKAEKWLDKNVFVIMLSPTIMRKHLFQAIHIQTLNLYSRWLNCTYISFLFSQRSICLLGFLVHWETLALNC